jgi:glycosyltransferase involved in cell wall biosynthesis
MISLVVPAFNESEVLRTLYERVSKAAAGWGDSWELIIIDDGSSDNTFDICAKIASADPRVKVLSFSRNFGHQAAVTAGLCYATGEIVSVIDADLQDPPEELIRFIDKCREGYDVVYAIRTKRKEGPLKRMAYHVYYRLLRWLASIDIPLDSGDFCVMSRRILDVMNALPERNRFVRGLRSWAGYRQIGLSYERQARLGGEPKYTFSKLVKLGLDGVFNFSYKPLHLLMLLGLGLGTLAFLGAFWVLVQYLTNITVFGYNPHSAKGWTSLMLAILFLAGVQLFGMGLLGEYTGRIFEEIKSRPVFVVGRAVNIEKNLRSGSAGGG